MTENRQTSPLPHDEPLLPAIRPGLADALLLVAAFLLIAGFFLLRQGTDLTLPLAPFEAGEGLNTHHVATFASPLLRGEGSPVKRPLAKNLVKAVRHAATADVPEGDLGLTPAREAFGDALLKLNALLLALAVLAVWLWLKVLLNHRRSVLPGAVALLLAISPWHTGLLHSALMSGELLGLFFFAMAMACYSVHPLEKPRAVWLLAMASWLFGGLALLCTEFALPLPLYAFVIDLALWRRGKSLGRLLAARLLPFYLPFVLLSLTWVALIRDAEVAWSMLPAAMDQLLQMLLNPVDAWDFFAVGRRPETLSGGWSVLAVLLLLAAAGGRLLLTRYRLTGVGLLGGAVSFLPAVLPHEHGQPFFSYAFLAFPAFFLLFTLTALLTELLAYPAETDESTEPSWTPEFLSSIAVAALLLVLLTTWRVWPTENARDFFVKGFKKHRDLPELIYTASNLEIARIQNLPTLEQQREAAIVSAQMLEDSLVRYIDLRQRGFEGPIDIPLREFREQADIYIKRQRIGRAIPMLEQALELEGENAELRYKLASLYMLAGESERAAEQFEIAFEQDPEGREALRLAEQAEKLNEFAILEVLLEEMQASDKYTRRERHQMLMGLGSARMQLGRPSEAIEPLNEALAVAGAPKEKAWMLLLNAQADAGNWEAVKQMTTAGDVPTSPTPNLADLVKPRAQAAVQANDANKTLQIMNAWVSLADTGRPRADALIHRGQFYEAVDKKLDALNDYRAAAESAPQYPEAYLALADFYRRNEFPQDARATLERAFELDPSNMRLLQVLVAHYQQYNLDDQAIRLLRRVVREEKRPQVLPRRLLAGIYMKNSVYEPAIELLTQARGIATDKRELSLMLAEAYSHTPEFEKGAEILADMIINEPKNPDLYLALIELYLEARQYDSALEALSYAIDACPPDARLWIKGGQISLLGRNLDSAEESYRRALRLEPENEAARRGLREVEEIRQRIADQRALTREAMGQRTTDEPQEPPTADGEAETDPLEESPALEEEGTSEAAATE